MVICEKDNFRLESKSSNYPRIEIYEYSLISETSGTRNRIGIKMKVRGVSYETIIIQSVCVCYLNRGNGGTAYTVDYAEKQKLEIINLAH